jgi:hypothetical protein
VATGARRVEGTGAVQHGRHLETHIHRAVHEKKLVAPKGKGGRRAPAPIDTRIQREVSMHLPDDTHG